jgi:hypothetical protein
LGSCHADDLGGAECFEAVDEGDADLDFGGLAVWLSGCRAAMRSPKAFRHRILASMLLRA